jgi:hypothetical protein
VGTGASTQGIVGTGASTQGIVGTGASTQGIVGTGASTQGIVGTGASTQGIVGTGASTQGIVGTGASTQGIVGTGASTQGIVGTGASTQGIVGTGASTQGIVGTGASTQGIVGTGASTQGIVGTGKAGAVQGMNRATFREWGATTNRGGFPLLAYGPIDRVTDNGYVVLGQHVFTSTEVTATLFDAGTTVAVFGVISDEGIFADRVVRIDEASVEGSSLVFLGGIVSNGPAADGSIQIGGLKVVIGSAGTHPESFALEAGDYVEVTGVRFAKMLLAESIAGE